MPLATDNVVPSHRRCPYRLWRQARATASHPPPRDGGPPPFLLSPPGDGGPPPFLLSPLGDGGPPPFRFLPSGGRWPSVVIVCLLTLLVFLPRPATARDRATQREWVKAYDLLEAAEQAESRQKWRDALRLYMDSREQFRTVHRRAPGWNPSLVNYRIKYCARKITALEKKLRLEQSARSPAELRSTLKRQADQLAQLRSETENLRYKLQITGEALEKARTEAARHLMARHRIPTLLAERRELDDRVKRLEEQLRKREADTTQRNEHRLADLQQEITALKANLGKAKAQASTWQERAEERETELRSARQKLRWKEERNAELKTALAGLAETTGVIQEEPEAKAPSIALVQTLRRRMTQLQERLQQAGEQLVDAQREEEELKGQIEARTQLVRKQEERIHTLEDEKTSLAKRLRNRPTQEDLEQAQAAASKAAQRNQADAKASTQTLQRLRKTVADQERELLALSTDLQESNAELATKTTRIETLSQRLEAASQDGNEDAYAGRITRLEQQLGEEHERTKRLEEALHDALAERDAAVAGGQDNELPGSSPDVSSQPPAPSASTPPADQDRAETERDGKEEEERALLLIREGMRAEETANTEAAVWNYTKALELNPRAVVPLHRLGLLATERGDDQEAAEYLRRAHRLEPEKTGILIPLGFSLVRLDRPYEAVATLARAIAIEPTAAEPHRALGVAASSLGWYDIAENELRQALKIDPDDSDSAFNLAILLASRDPDNVEEAKTWYLRARELSGQSDPALERVLGVKPEGN